MSKLKDVEIFHSLLERNEIEHHYSEVGKDRDGAVASTEENYIIEIVADGSNTNPGHYGFFQRWEFDKDTGKLLSVGTWE